MEQLSFFKEAGQSPGLPSELLEYHPELLDEAQSEDLLERLVAETPWSQKVVQIYDKQVITPRLTAWQIPDRL